ncbi:TetR/AcrR family transcriptional regulator [Pseudodesulfovibrio sp.]|uniref:TetR/AcrR family transcriptional regulator n=1 Tax=unclassified Pseudodesulfovibrio TaxID=2661612 RepID=UPI003B00BF87
MENKKNKNLSRKAQGEETRATLLAVGSRLFAQRGYDGVSMRTLANEAGVNLATVSYHFGGKSGLYQAILQRIITYRDDIFPKIDDIRERLAVAGSSIPGKCQVLDWFIDQLVRNLLGNSNMTWAAFLVSRELAQPSEWFEELANDFFAPSLDVLCTMAAGTLPEGSSREDIILTAHAIISIILKLLEGQALIPRRLGWENYASNMDTLSEIIRKRIRGLLGLPMEDA